MRESGITAVTHNIVLHYPSYLHQKACTSSKICLYTYRIVQILVQTVSSIHARLSDPKTNFPNHLSHGLQEIRLLDNRPSLIPHRLGQFVTRTRRFHRTRQTAVSSRQINRLFVNRDFGDQQFRVHSLFLAQAFRSNTTLFFRLGYTRNKVSDRNTKQLSRRICIWEGGNKRTE
jgi:hypothetical protein